MRTEIKTYTTADKMMMTGSMCGMMCMCCMGRFRAERYLILCVDRKCKTDVSAREHLFFCLKIKFVLIWSAECRQVLT